MKYLGENEFNKLSFYNQLNPLSRMTFIMKQRIRFIKENYITDPDEIENILHRKVDIYGLKKKEWWLWLNRVVTFLLVMYAWVFFRANTLSDALYASTKIFTNIPSPLFLNDAAHLLYAAFALLILFVSNLWCKDTTDLASFQTFLVFSFRVVATQKRNCDRLHA